MLGTSGRGRLPLVRAVGGCMGGAVVWAVLLACLGSVDGERSATGSCPEGEVCSEATPEGLRFVGTAFYDDQEEGVRLGPVLAGGRFSLGMTTPDDAGLPAFEVDTTDPAVLTGEPGTGDFLGDETFDTLVEGHATLRGHAAGQAHVRVVDPATGALYDRLRLDVYELERIDLVNLTDPSREHLLAGCEEMIGVRLVAEAGPTRFRAIDQDLTLRVDGKAMERERGLWDCFLYTPEEGRTETSVEIHAAGQVFVHRLAVKSLDEEGRAQCPPRRMWD